MPDTPQLPPSAIAVVGSLPYLLTGVTGSPVQAVFECNARPGDVLCAFSVSGESAGVNNTITAAARHHVPVIALVGTPESTTARLADCPILLGSAEPGIAEDVASAVMHAMYCTFMYETWERLPTGFLR